ncbi:hypothetical protein C1H76_8732 [Elsinoe australis]|uniref:Uncharacterized protein n=1 Tax=Elsinoe australis TaxID=40998 RepID=A0A4U7AU15_9PEZI|nr:hypothetical protein C1H76_8732 [Elsinoe australis]
MPAPCSDGGCACPRATEAKLRSQLIDTERLLVQLEGDYERLLTEHKDDKRTIERLEIEIAMLERRCQGANTVVSSASAHRYEKKSQDELEAMRHLNDHLTRVIAALLRAPDSGVVPTVQTNTGTECRDHQAATSACDASEAK